MDNQKFFGSFESLLDVANNFEVNISDIESVDIIAAVYDVDGYDGSAVVLFKEDGKIFRVTAGHCSCFGLENDGWEPQEITFDYLKKWVENMPGDFFGAIDCVRAFVAHESP